MASATPPTCCATRCAASPPTRSRRIADEIDQHQHFPAPSLAADGRARPARHHGRGGMRRRQGSAISSTSWRWKRSAAARRRSGLSYGAHSNLCVNQIRRNGQPEQKRRYLPKLISGEHVGALAMSESRLGLRRRVDEAARRQEGRPLRPQRHQDVDHQRSASPTRWWSMPRPTRTPARAASPPSSSRRASRDFTTAQKLDKLGMRGTDTGELVFEDCEVPEENVLGGEGRRRATC